MDAPVPSTIESVTPESTTVWLPKITLRADTALELAPIKRDWLPTKILFVPRAMEALPNTKVLVELSSKWESEPNTKLR